MMIMDVCLPDEGLLSMNMSFSDDSVQDSGNFQIKQIDHSLATQKIPSQSDYSFYFFSIILGFKGNDLSYDDSGPVLLGFSVEYIRDDNEFGHRKLQYVDTDVHDTLHTVSSDMHHLIDTNNELVLLKNAVNAAAFVAGVAYYGAVIWACPIPALALVGFKALEYSGVLDDYCGKDQELIAGYTVCDIVNTAIEGYLIYATGAKVAEIIGGRSGRALLGISTVTAKAVSKTLLSPKQLNQDDIKMPTVSAYIPNTVSEISYELLKQYVCDAVPGGRVVQIIVFKSLAQFSKEVSRELIRAEDLDFATNIPQDTLRGASKTTICKLLLDHGNDLIYLQLNPYCRDMVEYTFNSASTIYTDTQNEDNGGSNKRVT